MSETENTGATFLPVGFAIGVVVLLVGLVVNLQVIAPLGAAIALVAGLAWALGSGSKRRPTTPRPSASAEATGAERFPRSRMLERATLGIGGLVALGVVLPAVGAAVLPAVLNQRRRPVDLGPVGDFPQGQFVVATFISDPAMGEISRRTAYVRNNGFLGKSPSFTIMSSRCTHVGCPTQPNGPVFGQQRRALKTANGEVGLIPTDPAAGFGCPCHGASSTPRATARQARPRARSTATSSRSAAATSGSATSTASAASRARVQTRGSTASSVSATASPLPAPNRSSTPATQSHERLRARHQLGCDDERAAAASLGTARLREGARRLPHGAR